MRLPDSLKSSLADHVPQLEQKISIFADENKALLHWLREPGHNTAPARAGSATTAATPSRTTARPVFEESDNLVDPSKMLVPDDMLNLEEFESGVTPLACTNQ